MRKVEQGIFFFAAFAMAVLVLQVNVGYAQNHDHFKTYNVTPFPLPVPLLVTLVDQFGPVEGLVELIALFSNPVVKELPGGEISPIIDPDNHLTWYPFHAIVEPHTILVSNQFGPDQMMTVENTNFILLPAWKLYINGLPTGHNHPSTLDHYVCYDVTSGPPVGLAPVTLVDQFHQEVVEVGDPRVFCNPADKVIPDDGLPMYHPDNHLACYDIIPHLPPPPLEVFANDQFSDSIFMVLENELLCVPSQKCIVVDADEDGYYDINCGGDDCDDADPSVYPGAPQLCDGKDNTCAIYPAVPANESDDDSDGYVECTPWVGNPSLSGGDCNDANANIFPGNTNDNCDCVDPIPQGTPENQSAGNCADGEDNDCDGSIDTDPECAGSCAGSV